MNLFELGIRLFVNDEASDKIGSFKESLGNGLQKAAKVGVAAVTTAAAGITALTTAAVKSYAEYEQLVGGVETLFKSSADTVQQYAANAFKTAGMSANDYMENITGFSASLINSLGGDTAAAAEYANLAITDMSDNANKMGTSLDSIVATYQSIARGNFAMLDNLKLGYGGTKTELERLLTDAESFKAAMGETADYSIDNFADIVEAIHVVQEEMGIAGATALEAEGTITGSIGAMKGAWENLVVGFADGNQDLGGLVNEFIDSVVTVGENVIPRIAETVPRVIEGIGIALSEGVPLLIEAGQTAISGMISGFDTGFPAILQKGVDTINNFVNGIFSGLPSLLARLPEIIDTIVTFFATNYSRIMQAGAQILGNLISGIISAIPQLIAEAPRIIASFVGALVSNYPQVLSAGLSLIANLASGIISGIGSVISAVASVGSSILSGFGNIVSGMAQIGRNIVEGLWNGIGGMKDWVISKVRGFASSILDGFKNIFQIASPSKATRSMGENLAFGVIEGMERREGAAIRTAEEMGAAILEAAETKLEEFKEYNDLTAREELDFWKRIVEQTEVGTEARIKAEDKYYSALDAYKTKHENYVNSIMSQMSLFSEFSPNQEVTGQGLISNLFSQVSGLETYSRVMKELEEKIGGTALFSELQSKGIGSLGEIEAINALNANRLDYYVGLYDKKASLASQVSPYSAATSNNYNFTFNSPESLSASDARRESRRAYNDMVLGY